MTNEQLFREALEAIRDANLDDCCPPRSLQEIAAAALRRAVVEPTPRQVEPFVVKHYVGDERPTIKGNGFDGLEVGEDRQDAEDFIKWLNERLGVKSEPVYSVSESWFCTHCDECFLTRELRDQHEAICTAERTSE